MNALNRTWKKLLKQKLTDGSKPSEAAPSDESKPDFASRFRPLLHVSPPAGWLNDPNGLCQYQGMYHAFYQFSPFDAEGGLKFWGHCISRDLLHWEFVGVPLTPDTAFDCHGCYSGCAFSEDGKLYLYYTGNVKETGSHDYIHTGRQSNTILAESDGMQIIKKTPVMTNADYPPHLTCHVRDPKVWKQDGTYYMIQGARTDEDQGVALLFASHDRESWHLLHTLQTARPFGYMWECPDLFELDGKTILSVSPQGVSADGLRFQNRYQSVVFFLEGDFRNARVGENCQELDSGFDFYAPQTFRADDGRRILIAWMGMPDETEYHNPTVAFGWQHTLTLPRELSIQDGKLCQNPVRELSAWWNREIAFAGDFCGQAGGCFELELFSRDGDVTVTLAGGLTLCYREDTKQFDMEFQDSLSGSGRKKRSAEIKSLSRIRLVADVSCLEVFLNNGETVFSTRFYPQDDVYEIRTQGCIRGVYRTHS